MTGLVAATLSTRSDSKGTYAKASSTTSLIGGAVNVTILFEEKAAVFGWADQTPARQFGDELRAAVRHLTGASELNNLDILTDTNPPKRVTPRDVFEQRYPEAQNRFRIVPRSKVPAPLVAAPEVVQSSTALKTLPVALEVPGAKSVSGQLSVPQRQKPSGKFQRAGGTQLQFIQMLEGNKNPKVALPEGTVLSQEEVAKHATAGDCWTIFQGRVYDITLYIDFHPGGKRQIMQGAGKDMTSLFQKAHPWVSMDGLLGKLCLGPVAKAERAGAERPVAKAPAPVTPYDKAPVEVLVEIRGPSTVLGNPEEHAWCIQGQPGSRFRVEFQITKRSVLVTWLRIAEALQG
eukprot:symbB.v1.2.011199.t1/scaffold718.1/size169569/5